MSGTRRLPANRLCSPLTEQGAQLVELRRCAGQSPQEERIQTSILRRCSKKVATVLPSGSALVAAVSGVRNGAFMRWIQVISGGSIIQISSIKTWLLVFGATVGLAASAVCSAYSCTGTID